MSNEGAFVIFFIIIVDHSSFITNNISCFKLYYIYHNNIVNWMQNLYFMRLRAMYNIYNSITQALGLLRAVMYICEMLESVT